MDERNSLQDKLTALESKYLENNRELATLRKENAQLLEQKAINKKQTDSYIDRIAELT